VSAGERVLFFFFFFTFLVFPLFSEIEKRDGTANAGWRAMSGGRISWIEVSVFFSFSFFSSPPFLSCHRGPAFKWINFGICGGVVGGLAAKCRRYFVPPFLFSFPPPPFFSFSFSFPPFSSSGKRSWRDSNKRLR